MLVQTDGEIRGEWEALLKDFDTAAFERPDIGAVVCFDDGLNWQSPMTVERSMPGLFSQELPCPPQFTWRYRPSGVLSTYSSNTCPTWRVWLVTAREQDIDGQRQADLGDALKCFDYLCKQAVRLAHNIVPATENHSPSLDWLIYLSRSYPLPDPKAHRPTHAPDVEHGSESLRVIWVPAATCVETARTTGEEPHSALLSESHVKPGSELPKWWSVAFENVFESSAKTIRRMVDDPSSVLGRKPEVLPGGPLYRDQTLYVDGKVIKHWQGQASRQKPLLQAFEDAKWKDEIRVPKGSELSKRIGGLSQVVRSPKKSLPKGCPIVFCMNGGGDGVKWARNPT